jgi:hypothetical protein
LKVGGAASYLPMAAAPPSAPPTTDPDTVLIDLALD